jgi:hypothetical protein
MRVDWRSPEFWEVDEALWHRVREREGRLARTEPGSLEQAKLQGEVEALSAARAIHARVHREAVEGADTQSPESAQEDR